jgi:hypothetical protein
VNGDGYSNDRAFIFDPAKTADPVLASAMRSLIDNSTGSAKECLQSQLGTLAIRNSCTGPWTTNANLSISFNPLKVRLPQRATLSFSISNPLGAADLLLHGESKLHGWGQQTFVDPTLMYVRGFDSTSNRYKYEINPRFGPPKADGSPPDPRPMPAAMTTPPLPACEFSHIFETGEHEIVSLPTTSPLADRFGCAARDDWMLRRPRMRSPDCG